MYLSECYRVLIPSVEKLKCSSEPKILNLSEALNQFITCSEPFERGLTFLEIPSALTMASTLERHYAKLYDLSLTIAAAKDLSIGDHRFFKDFLETFIQYHTEIINSAISETARLFIAESTITEKKEDARKRKVALEKLLSEPPSKEPSSSEVTEGTGLTDHYAHPGTWWLFFDEKPSSSKVTQGKRLTDHYAHPGTWWLLS